MGSKKGGREAEQDTESMNSQDASYAGLCLKSEERKKNSVSLLCKPVRFFALVVFQLQGFCFALGYLVKTLFKKFQTCLK